MKKATIIIIAAIYVASIVIVGVFGLRALIYNEIVFVQDIVFAEQIGGKDIRLTSDGKMYSVVLDYKEGLAVPIEFSPVPADATRRNEIEASIIYDSGGDENPCASIERGIVMFSRKGQVIVRVMSPDGGKVSKDIRITAR